MYLYGESYIFLSEELIKGCYRILGVRREKAKHHACCNVSMLSLITSDKYTTNFFQNIPDNRRIPDNTRQWGQHIEPIGKRSALDMQKSYFRK